MGTVISITGEIPQAAIDAIEDILDSHGAEYRVGGFELPDPLGLARSDDPDTSKKAAKAHKLTRRGHTLTLLTLYVRRQEFGWTADELAEETGIEYRTLTPRIGYLKRHGFIAAKNPPERRKGQRGLEQEVKVVTEYGLAQYKAFHKIS